MWSSSNISLRNYKVILLQTILSMPPPLRTTENPEVPARHLVAGYPSWKFSLCNINNQEEHKGFRNMKILYLLKSIMTFRPCIWDFGTFLKSEFLFIAIVKKNSSLYKISQWIFRIWFKMNAISVFRFWAFLS